MKNWGLYLMALLYIAAGLNHFANEPFYTKMLQDFLPYPQQLVYVSGVFEALLGIGLLLPVSRKLSAAGIILLLIAVFPANIRMALYGNEWQMPSILLYLRLPLQLPLIWWAYAYFKPEN